MIDRYTRPEMGHIFSLENKYAIWQEIEVLACEAQAELGQAGITREEAQAPVIAFDVNTGVYTAKVGREFTIAPTYEYVDRAVYAWKLEKTGRIISTEPVLTYVIDEVEGEEKEDYYCLLYTSDAADE